MSGDHHDHSTHIKIYGATFTFLTVLTGIELLPLWGILNLPPPLLLGMSLVKFVVVVFFFMHLYGDKPINQRLFFIPMVMAGLSFMVLMGLFGTWRLQWPDHTPHPVGEAHAATTEGAHGAEAGHAPAVAEPKKGRTGKDAPEVVARYAGRHTGPCNAWVKSGLTGNLYCSSPVVPWSTQPAYDRIAAEAAAAAAADPAFADFDKKSPEEKKALLMEKGKTAYDANCASCHKAEGTGSADMYPPLAADPLANGGDTAEHIKVVLNGLSGKQIAGKSYTGVMASWKQLSDDQIASIITYERNSWGNSAGIVEPSQVAAAR